MFCKYCDQPISGNKCAFCGREIVIRDYSKELEKMMLKSPQNTLKTSNGKAQQDQIDKPVGENSFENTRKSVSILNLFTTKLGKRSLLVAGGFLFFLGLIVGSIICGRVFYSKGLITGKEQGSQIVWEETKQELTNRYNKGLETGYHKGYSEGYTVGVQEGHAVYEIAESISIEINNAGIDKNHNEQIEDE